MRDILRIEGTMKKDMEAINLLYNMSELIIKELFEDMYIDEVKEERFYLQNNWLLRDEEFYYFVSTYLNKNDLELVTNENVYLLQDDEKVIELARQLRFWSLVYENINVIENILIEKSEVFVITISKNSANVWESINVEVFNNKVDNYHYTEYAVFKITNEELDIPS